MADTPEAREWPDAEVEKAAEWLYDFARRDRGYDGGDWETLIAEFKDGWRGKAREVLEASGAVPRAEHERVKALKEANERTYEGWVDALRVRAEEAESQLAAVREASREVAATLRRWVDDGLPFRDKAVRELADKLDGSVSGGRGPEGRD